MRACVYCALRTLAAAARRRVPSDGVHCRSWCASSALCGPSSAQHMSGTGGLSYDTSLHWLPEFLEPEFRASPSAGRAEALAELKRQGFAILPQRFLSPRGIDFAQTALLRMMDARHPTVGVGELVSPYQRPGGEWMWQLATQPAILDIVEAQVGPDVLLWSGGPGCKAPLEDGVSAEDNGLIPWHQDAPYWNVHPLRHAAAIWIAVSDVDSGNGTMSVIPTGPHDLARTHVLPREVDQEKLAINMSGGKPSFSDSIDPRAMPSTPPVSYNLSQKTNFHCRSVFIIFIMLICQDYPWRAPTE